MKRSVLAATVSLLIYESVPALNAGWSSLYATANDAWCNGSEHNLYSGDFNGDGLHDILCHDTSSGRRQIDFAEEEFGGFYGTDWDSLDYPSAAQHWCTNAGEKIYVGDFSGDNRDDLLCHVSRGYPNAGRRRIDFANSAGTFFKTEFNSADYPSAAQHWCTNAGEKLYVGDFNGDNRDDLLCYVSSGYPNAGRRRIDFANSAGTFFGTEFNSADYPSAAQHWCTNAGEKLYVGDFNGDNRDDLLCHARWGYSNAGRRRVDFADSAGRFDDTDFDSEMYPSAAQYWCSNSDDQVYVGDFDHDGRSDLLCVGKSTGNMRIDHANGSGTFFGTDASSTEYWCDGSGDRVHVKDFNGDGRADLLCHNRNSGYRALRYANSEGDLFSVCSDQSTQGDGALLPLGVHFVVLSDPNHPDVSDRSMRMPTATSTHTHPIIGAHIDQTVDPEAYFRAEVDVINEYMYDESRDQVCDGDDCLQFVYASHTFFSEASSSSCDALLKLANPSHPKWALSCDQSKDGNALECGEGSVHSSTWTGSFDKAIEECDDRRLWRPDAINVYIMDQCNWDSTSSSGLSNSACRARMISYGFASRHAVAASYERLLRGPITGDRDAARGVEQHEFGHVLGLGHTHETCTYTDPMHREPEGGKFCGAIIATCAGDREAGFSTAVVPWDGGDKCTTVNQITTLVGNAREAQTEWSCR